MKLTRAMLEQVQSYVEDRDRDGHDGGWYYGNKVQFEKRHTMIKAWLKDELRVVIKCGCDRSDPNLCCNGEESTGTCYCKCH